MLVEAATGDGRLLRFAISLSDIQHFVSFLLVTACKKSGTREVEDPSAPADVAGGAPIPVTSIGFGESGGNAAYLEIAVGQAELTFSVPMSVIDPLARTMLTVSAQPKSQYKM